MKIVWSPTALQHFANWIGFIAKDSPKSAQNERLKILKKVEQLKKFPRIGRMVPEFGSPLFRELVKKPIRIIYSLRENRVEILTLHHSRQKFDIELFP